MQIPTNCVQDAEYLDAARSVGNLTLPRFVQQTTWAKSDGIAGRPVLDLHPAHFLYQNWNSCWLRHIAHGRECYMMAAKNKGELVLVQELLVQLRTQNVDLESEAMNLATQQHQSLAKNLAMKTLANHLVQEILKLVPTTTDPESQDKSSKWPSYTTAARPQSTASPLPLATPSGPNTGGTTTPNNQSSSTAGPSNMKQQPLLFNTPTKVQSPGPSASQDTITQEVAPDTIMQPPIEGCSWLALNVPTKTHDRELNKWISSPSINEKKKKALNEWLATVDKWVNSLGLRRRQASSAS